MVRPLAPARPLPRHGRAPLRPALALLAAVAALGGSPRVLGPEAAGDLRRTIGASGFSVRDVAVLPDRATGTACDAEGRCGTFELGDPRLGCPGTVSGPFCVTGSPPDLAARVAGALAAAPDPWRVVDGGETAAVPTPEPGSPWAGWLLAAALLVGPWLAGRIGAAFLRRVLPGGVRVAATAVFATGALAAVPFAVRIRPDLGVWDAALAALVLVLTLLRRGLPAKPPETRPGALLVLAGSALVFGGALELWARSRPPLGPPLAPPGEARLLFDPYAAEQGCLALFPDDRPGGVPLLRDAAPASGRKRVLHLGDSMVAGSGVDNRVETFVARLDGPEVGHLNAGVPGIGTDMELLLFREWAGRLRPDAAVLHVSPGTDVTELDRAYTCCRGGSVLLPDSLERRCETPSWLFPWEVLLARSPPPFPLRVLGHVSKLAADVVHVWSRLAWRFEPNLGLENEGSAPSERELARFDQMLSAFAEEARARGVPLLVSVLPDRASLDADDPRSRPAWSVRERALARARALGLPAVDGWAPFLGDRENVAGAFGTSVPWDPHFSPDGHLRYAELLREPVARLLRRP